MTCLFSKWGVNNYDQGRGGWVEIGGLWNILENPTIFKVHWWRQWICFGIFYLKYNHQYDSMKMQFGFWEICSHIWDGPWKFLRIRVGSWICFSFFLKYNPSLTMTICIMISASNDRYQDISNEAGPLQVLWSLMPKLKVANWSVFN